MLLMEEVLLGALVLVSMVIWFSVSNSAALLSPEGRPGVDVGGAAWMVVGVGRRTPVGGGGCGGVAEVPRILVHDSVVAAAAVVRGGGDRKWGHDPVARRDVVVLLREVAATDGVALLLVSEIGWRRSCCFWNLTVDCSSFRSW